MQRWLLWQRWIARRIPAARQVRLDQRRIFIMPSRAGAGFALVLLLMLLVAINYQNSLAYALTFLLAAVFVLTILHSFRNVSGLQLQAANPAAVFAGEQARFAVVLRSPGRACRSIGLGWPGQPVQFVDVPAGGQCACPLDLPAAARGWLRAPRMKLYSDFPLGVIQVWSWIDLDQRVLVYPQPLAGPLPCAMAAAETEHSGEVQRLDGVDDFQGLRSYQPGDSRRRLDWKAYSRGQGLQVKDFASLAGSSQWLDFQHCSGDLESRLAQLCYWVLQLEAAQQPYGLRLPGEELPPAWGAQQRERCLQALALFRAGT